MQHENISKGGPLTSQKGNENWGQAQMPEHEELPSCVSAGGYVAKQVHISIPKPLFKAQNNL